MYPGVSFHTLSAVRKSASHVVDIPDAKDTHAVRPSGRNCVQEEILNAVSGGRRHSSFSVIMIKFCTD